MNNLTGSIRPADSLFADKYNYMRLKARSCDRYELQQYANTIEANDAGMQEFNALLAAIEQYAENHQVHTLKRTPSGAIDCSSNGFRLHSWDVKIIDKGKAVVLTWIGAERAYLFQFSSAWFATGEAKKHQNVSGNRAYAIFRQKCNEMNIDLGSMAIRNGREVKETIPRPMVSLADERMINRSLNNCHHIDINSAYMAGIAARHPELAPVIRELYSERKKKHVYKHVLTHAFGYFQSEYCRFTVDGIPCAYALAHLSKSAIEWTIDKLISLAQKVTEAGGKILLYNADGFWYRGEPYHDDDEGTDLGQWKLDHTDCKLRIKSVGAYEYIESDFKGDPVYTPVVRGFTHLDLVKPRESWVWGDIYEYGNVITYRYNPATNRIEEAYDGTKD